MAKVNSYKFKSHKVKIFVLLAVTLIMFITMIKNSSEISHTKKNVPVAVKGVLDLRNWDFKKDGMIKLNGAWEFYDNQLNIPSDFQRNTVGTIRYEQLPGVFGKQGYCTYRMKLLLNKQQQQHYQLLHNLLSILIDLSKRHPVKNFLYLYAMLMMH